MNLIVGDVLELIVGDSGFINEDEKSIGFTTLRDT